MKKSTKNILNTIIRAIGVAAIFPVTAILTFTLGNISKNDTNLVSIKEHEEPIEQSTHNHYVSYGRYYMNADLQWEVITEDGNVWLYDQDTISDAPRYHGEPVGVVFSDNSTPDDIYDDIILGLTLDRTTAIYDELEDALSEKFDVERDGNTITVEPTDSTVGQLTLVAKEARVQKLVSIKTAEEVK